MRKIDFLKFFQFHFSRNRSKICGWNVFETVQVFTNYLPNKNQRTNGPVNPHLRSAVYTNVIENSPSVGADEALGPFFFSE